MNSLTYGAGCWVMWLDVGGERVSVPSGRGDSILVEQQRFHEVRAHLGGFGKIM